MQAEALDSVQTNNADSVDVLVSAVIEEVKPEPVISLFENHMLQPLSGLEPQLIEPNSNGFAFAVIGICIIMIIYLQRNSDGIFSSVIRGSFDLNLTLQESRVDNSQRSRNMLLLQLLSLMAISLLVSGSIRYFSSNALSQIEVFLWVFTGLLGFSLLKKGIQWVLASLFQLRIILKGYHFSSSILMASSGLGVLPICLLLFFSPQIPSVIPVYSALAVICFFYFKSMLRGIQMAMAGNSVSPLHLFYYLCALEILPVFVLIRFALNG